MTTSDKITNFFSNSISQTSNYKVFLPFLGEDIQYALRVQMPDFTLTPIEVYPGSGKMGYTGGDSIQYGEMSVTFSVGEDLGIYKKILNYFHRCVHDNSGVIDDDWDFEAGVEITNNSGYPVMAIEFHRCKLVNLSDLTLDNTQEDAEQEITLSFKFSYYTPVDKLDLNSLKNGVSKRDIIYS